MPEKRIEMVHFQITKNCNLRCWFCGQWGKKGFFSDSRGEAVTFAEWKRLAEELVAYRAETGISPFIMLWGGEPLSAPYFDELAKYLKARDFTLGMVTNCTMLAEHKKTVEECISIVYASIDGPKDIHNEIRGGGVFEKVTENLTNLHGCKIVVMSVVTGKLIARLEEFLDALEPVGIDELYLQDMIGLTAEETADYKAWMKSAFDIDATDINSWNGAPELFDTEAALAEINTEKYSYKITCKKHHGNDGAHCMSPFRHAHIAWNGNVLYCTDFYDFSAGNIKNNTLSEIFNNELSEKYREEIVRGNCATCRNCSWRERRNYIEG